MKKRKGGLPPRIQWDIVFAEYMKGYTLNEQPKEYTYNEIAQKFNLNPLTVERKGNLEHWVDKRASLRLKEKGLQCVDNLVLPEDITPESVDAIVYDRLKLLSNWGKRARNIDLSDEKKLSEILVNYKKILGGIDKNADLTEKHNIKHLDLTINQLFGEKFKKPVEGSAQEVDQE